MAFATLEDIQIGESGSQTRTVAESDVYLLTGIFGNTGPIHLDEEFSKKSRFGARIAPGILIGGLCQGALTNLTRRLAFKGTPYRGALVSIYYKFVGPTKIGDTITATATIAEKLPARSRWRAEMKAVNQRGETVCVGEIWEQIV
ncbi:MAG: MaoC family dehydratase [Chloroflexi bacterium]|nr:MaoC family dehydratase [Chloroflexota bacterium]